MRLIAIAGALGPPAGLACHGLESEIPAARLILKADAEARYAASK